MTVVMNMHKKHDYEAVMTVLCTSLQVKCYHILFRNTFCFSCKCIL